MTKLIKRPTQVPTRKQESGKAGYALAWLLGIPLPILLIVYAVTHC